MTTAPDGWEGLLDPGEKILWQGRPDPGIFLHATHIVMGLFGAAFAGFALFWMIMAWTAGGYFWTFGLLHFSIGLIIMLGGPLGGPYIRRHTWYSLSNRRAFIATDFPLLGKRLNSYPIRPDTPIIFDDGDRASIFFATKPVRTKNGLRNEAIGFERIAEGRDVMSLIRQIQNQRPDDSAKPQDTQ